MDKAMQRCNPSVVKSEVGMWSGPLRGSAPFHSNFGTMRYTLAAPRGEIPVQDAFEFRKLLGSRFHLPVNQNISLRYCCSVFCPNAPESLGFDSSNYESAPPPIVENVVGSCVCVFSLRREIVHQECNRKHFRPCSPLPLSHTLYSCTCAPSRRNGYLEIASERP